MSQLRQETVAIIGVGIALAILGLSVAAGLRDEIRAVRAEVEAVRVEARADRDAIRAEARADREEFQRQILRLTERQGVLTGLVEGVLQERREAEGTPAP